MAGWAAIVGAAGTNKSATARQVARRLERRGLRVGGFLQVDVADAAGETQGWDVERVSDGERVTLARRSADPTLCSYAFVESGFARAAAWARDEAEVVVIGGVGKLEAAQGGHWPALEALVREPSAPLVIACVRDSCLATVAFALPDPAAHIMLPCDAAEVARFADEIAGALGH